MFTFWTAGNESDDWDEFSCNFNDFLAWSVCTFGERLVSLFNRDNKFPTVKLFIGCTIYFDDGSIDIWPSKAGKALS